jgi:hypothetical protein
MLPHFLMAFLHAGLRQQGMQEQAFHTMADSAVAERELPLLTAPCCSQAAPAHLPHLQPHDALTVMSSPRQAQGWWLSHDAGCRSLLHCHCTQVQRNKR